MEGQLHVYQQYSDGYRTLRQTVKIANDFNVVTFFNLKKGDKIKIKGKPELTFMNWYDFKSGNYGVNAYFE